VSSLVDRESATFQNREVDMTSYGRSRSRRRKLPHSVTQHLPPVCQVCGFTKGLQDHHIDWNRNNNSVGNLQRLCQWCHIQAHKLGKPEFDRLQEIVNADSDKKAELEKTASKYHYANQSKLS